MQRRMVYPRIPQRRDNDTSDCAREGQQSAIPELWLGEISGFQYAGLKSSLVAHHWQSTSAERSSRESASRLRDIGCSDRQSRTLRMS